MLQDPSGIHSSQAQNSWSADRTTHLGGAALLGPWRAECCTERSVLSPENLRKDGVTMKGMWRRGHGSALR